MSRITDLDLSTKLKDIGLCQQSGILAYQIGDVDIPENKKVLCVGFADWQLMRLVGKFCDGNYLGFPMQSRVQAVRAKGSREILQKPVYIFSYQKVSFVAEGETICEVMVDVILQLIQNYGVSVGRMNDELKEMKHEFGG